MSLFEERMNKARDVGRKRFLELSGPEIEIKDSSFRIEFEITRWVYWGLLWKGTFSYVKHFFKVANTSATGYKYDWTPSRELALLLYLFPLVDHLTFHHKLYVKEKPLRKLREACDDPDELTAPWVLSTLYGKTKCLELKKLREA